MSRKNKYEPNCANEIKKMGRPKKEIDYLLVEKLANLMCTQQEIASVLEVSTKTLQRDPEFCRIYNIGIQCGKMSLRRYQMKLAEKTLKWRSGLASSILNRPIRLKLSRMLRCRLKTI